MNNLPNKVKLRHFLSVKEQFVRKSPPNGRKSTRYNIFTFIPMTILYQFTRVINCFYVLNAIL